MSELTKAEGSDNELAFESALRPKSLGEFIGQSKVRNQLKLILDAAAIQNRTPDHILLAGPPGLGKTTLAMIVAHEGGQPLRLTSGPTIQHAGDLAAILSSLAPGEVLFIDEIHRMARSAEEMLYLAMEDYRVDVMVGKEPAPHRFRSRLRHSPWLEQPLGLACCRVRYAIDLASSPILSSTKIKNYSR